jgi:hypothetical protein
MSADDLAKELFTALDTKDGDGNTIASTDGAVGFAKGFIAMMKAGKMLSTVTGGGMPNGVPFPGSVWSFIGTSSKGNFIALVPALMSAEVIKAIPTGQPPLMLLEATAVSTYFMTQANITFAQVTGQCTAVAGPTPAPGVLAAGQADGGKVVGISGAAMAAHVAPLMGVPVSQGMIKMYDALCKYVMQNIELSFPVGQVLGTFPPPPPAPIPIVAGLGTGGIIR